MTVGIGMTSQRTRERLIERLRTQGISDERVLAALRTVPRHMFLDEALNSRAYEDTALPIGHGQTISQPYIVARMSELVLSVAPARVLEIGTGCGYQAAVLGQLVTQVFSVERLAPLYRRARLRLGNLGARNVMTRLGDGALGWPEQAPFDAVLVTAGAVAVPEALKAQVRPGGLILMPLGAHQDQQELTLLRRVGNVWESGRVQRVSFVPLLSGVE